jgi:hypothetical protein
MIIANFHVQHILKAYSQQLSVRSRVSKDKLNKTVNQNDEVTFSQEGKKMLVIDKISQEIMSQFKNGSERNDTSREILDRLSQEYGHPLDVVSNGEQDISFKILGETEGETERNLSLSENEALKKRLFDITRSVVNDHLI